MNGADTKSKLLTVTCQKVYEGIKTEEVERKERKACKKESFQYTNLPRGSNSNQTVAL